MIPFLYFLFDYYEYLDINTNRIGPKGIESLSKMSLTNLKYLNISFNEIGDKGRKIISEIKIKNIGY